MSRRSPLPKRKLFGILRIEGVERSHNLQLKNVRAHCVNEICKPPSPLAQKRRCRFVPTDSRRRRVFRGRRRRLRSLLDRRLERRPSFARCAAQRLTRRFLQK